VRPIEIAEPAMPLEPVILFFLLGLLAGLLPRT
jgi:hypothetical protein